MRDCVNLYCMSVGCSRANKNFSMYTNTYHMSSAFYSRYKVYIKMPCQNAIWKTLENLKLQFSFVVLLKRITKPELYNWIYIALTNSMAYGTRRFSAAFARALQ